MTTVHATVVCNDDGTTRLVLQPIHQAALAPNSISRCLSHAHLLHALCGLTRDVDALVHLEARLLDVQVLVETRALTPLRDDR